MLGHLLAFIMEKLLGDEVDKPSQNFDQNIEHKKYIESDFQNIEAPRIDDYFV